MGERKIIPIRSEADILAARQQGRELAKELGFSSVDLTFLATAISELARNIVAYAGDGRIVLDTVHTGSRRGIAVAACDEGPGISDVALAMQDGYSTGQGLGLGLPGTKRLMDEFEISSEVGKGTTVTTRKWQQ